MKHLKILALITFLSVTLSSCTDDWFGFGEKECVVGDPVYAVLDFGNGSYEDVTINTRGTFDGTFEHLVRNFYILVFKDNGNGTGEKVYGRYFNVDNKTYTIDDVKGVNANKKSQCWAVVAATAAKENGKDKIENDYKVLGDPTHGSVRIKTPSGGPYNIYMIANIQDAYLDLSPELFDGLENEDQMINQFVRLENSPITRTSMLMIGSVKGVTVNDDGTIKKDGQKIEYVDKTNNNSLKLKRIDAKIEVRIHVDPTRDNKDLPQYDLKANKVKDFHPQSWEVVNLTNRTKLVDTFDGTNYDENENKAEYYYDSGTKNFEEEKDITVSSGTKSADVTDYRFSFYMFENHQKNKKDAGDDYHNRDKRLKDQDGKYVTNGETWEYAPERGTYLKITGQVEMDYSEANNITGKAQTLYADVVYYIHLGNFQSAKGMNDFDVMRNTRYTYNISIVDVNQIIVEVQTSQPESANPYLESQSGATGDVFIAKQKICRFDAHYGQDVLCFYADDIEDNLTWYVETPFNKQGGGPEDNIPLDYKWVKYARNLLKDNNNAIIESQDEDTNIENQHYSKLNRWYPGDAKLTYNPQTPSIEKLMYVDQLVAYLHEQKAKFVKNDPNDPSDFRKEIIKVPNGNTTVDKEVDVIYVTAFVDDYYYDEVPVSGAGVENLWTMFVNDCGPRMMHILCDNKRSNDGESSYTNSVFTIRQTPIQTIYNTDLKTAPKHAWGCETVDENGVYKGSKGLTYGTNIGEYLEVVGYNGTNLLQQNVNVNNGYNGLYNTWDMCGFNKGNSTSWKEYLVIYNDTRTPLYWELPESYDETEPDHVQTPGTEKPLRDNIHFIKERKWLYSYLVRNRDDNGDGKIEPREIKWYIASLDQLQMLFIGSEGISGEAQIYPDKYTKEPGDAIGGVEQWRLHILSSTIKEYGRPHMLWAEEGVSVSPCKEWDLVGVKGMRCVRNLGTQEWDGTGYPEMYDPAIVVTNDFANNRINIDARRLNRKSLRGGGLVDPYLETLQTTDEYGEYALLPLGFSVYCNSSGKAFNYTWAGNGGTNYYGDLKTVLDNNIQLAFPERHATTETPKESWRMPNIREMAVIYAYANYALNETMTAASTYYSLGKYGSKKGTNGAKRACWFFTNTLATMNVGDVTKPLHYILVRDWQPY